MADPSETHPYQSAAEFNAEYLHDGLHISAILIDSAVVLQMGMVVLHWGHFEFKFDRVIEGFLAAVQRDVPGWEPRAFRRRKTMFRDLATELFSVERPEVESRLHDIAGTAAGLYWKRNLVVHGAYASQIAANSSSAKFWATGHHKGRKVEIDLDVPTLSRLWHDIAHVSGNLDFTARMVGEVHGFGGLTFEDTEILRILREGSGLPTPTPEVPLRPLFP